MPQKFGLSTFTPKAITAFEKKWKACIAPKRKVVDISEMMRPMMIFMENNLEDIGGEDDDTLKEIVTLNIAIKYEIVKMHEDIVHPIKFWFEELENDINSLQGKPQGELGKLIEEKINNKHDIATIYRGNVLIEHLLDNSYKSVETFLSTLENLNNFMHNDKDKRLETLRKACKSSLKCLADVREFINGKNKVFLDKYY